MKSADPDVSEAIAAAGIPEKRENAGKGRPIGRQLIAWLVVLSFALVAISYAIQTWIVLPAFAKIEHDGALKDIERCATGLARDLELMSNQVTDWAWWDDTYDYVVDRNTDYLEANLEPETFSTAKINVLALYDSSRELVWGQVRDLETMEEVAIPEFWDQVEDPANRLIAPQHLSDGKDGIIVTHHGPLLFSSRGIRTSKEEGPLRGALLMGRFLDDREMAGLADRLQVNLKSWTLGIATPTLPAEELALVSEHSDLGEPVIKVHDNETLRAYVVVTDILDQPAVLLRADVPRKITSQGRFSAGVAMLASFIGGLFLIVTAGFVIRKRVVAPLELVAAHAQRVGQEDDMKARLNMNRADEIGVLANAFDTMVMNLAETRKTVVNSAHQAGMSDVATEVLHNVGNVVNSANAAVEALAEDSRKKRSDGLSKALDLIGDSPSDAAEFFQKDPKAEMLIRYLFELNSNLEMDQESRKKHISRLSDSIDHMRTVVSFQQTHANRSEFLQDVDVSNLAMKTLRLNQARIAAADIEVIAELDEFPEVRLNRSKLSQVLMNLVKNAIEAMEGDSIKTRQLLFRVKYVDDEGVSIEVGDTGCGVSDVEMPKLFSQGYSTKSFGNGIGLHYCINTIRSMGATLTAESEGVGKGTIFKIWIPMGDEAPETTTHHSPVVKEGAAGLLSTEVTVS